jgi:hypothetical protein
VVVFEATGRKAPTYEEMSANASPVLVEEIPGKALSWTPSADKPLINGGSYVWYVGAMVNAAQGQWSEGRRFVVAESVALGVVSEQPITRTIEDNQGRKINQEKDLELAEAAKENFNLTADSRNLVEGSEGNENTFYGLGAGNSTTGK